MPRQIKLSMAAIVVIVTVISTIIGGSYSIAKFSYDAGAQKNKFDAQIHAVTIVSDKNRVDIVKLQVDLREEIKLSREADEELKDSVHSLDTNLAVQTVLLEEIKEKL